MLETEIKKLTTAIYELNATLEAQGLSLPTQPPVGVGNDEPKHSGKSVKDVVEEAVEKTKVEKVKDQEDDVNPEPEPRPDEVSDQEEDVNPATHTADSVRKMALAVSRKDRSKQRDIKAKLAERNAKLATDLKGDDLQAFGDWLQALKEELGA